jgi:TetR/AcrR family transcriptional regulator, copper-responsive repressor
MVQVAKKAAKRGRGRPLGHDPAQVRERVRDAFWEGGFSGTSLDQLAEAAGVNRPTLYASFGDKRGMYLAAIEEYSNEMRPRIGHALREPNLREALRGYYAAVIERFVSGRAPRGCLVVCTATVEATQDPEVRRALKRVLFELDTALTARLEHAQRQGDLDPQLDPAATAQLLAAVQHSLAVRARAGEARAQLHQLAEHTVELVCGAKRRAKTKS